MKKKLLYSILALTLFSLACKKDDKPKTGQIDKAKVTSLLEKMNAYENFVTIPMMGGDFSLSKAAKNRVFNGDEFFPPMGGVTPTIKETPDGYIIYEYDFDNPSNNSADYDGIMTIKMSPVALLSFEITYVNFKDNTLKDVQGAPIANLTNGYFKISGSDDAIIINSDLIVAAAGQPTFTTKFKDFSVKETATGSESNGSMEFITGNDKYTYEFTKVIEKDECDDLPVSGMLKITSSNPVEVLEIDFGNGTCDNKVTAKYNGVTEEIVLDDDHH